MFVVLVVVVSGFVDCGGVVEDEEETAAVVVVVVVVLGTTAGFVDGIVGTTVFAGVGSGAVAFILEILVSDCNNDNDDDDGCSLRLLPADTLGFTVAAVVFNCASGAAVVEGFFISACVSC